MADPQLAVPTADDITQPDDDADNAREAAKARPVRSFVDTVVAANLRKTPLMLGCITSLQLLTMLAGLTGIPDGVTHWWISTLTLLAFLSIATIFTWRFAESSRDDTDATDRKERHRRGGILNQMTDAVCIAAAVIGLGMSGMIGFSHLLFAMVYLVFLVHAILGVANTVWPQWSPRAARVPSAPIFLATCYLVYMVVIVAAAMESHDWTSDDSFDDPFSLGQTAPPPPTGIYSPVPDQTSDGYPGYPAPLYTSSLSGDTVAPPTTGIPPCEEQDISDELERLPDPSPEYSSIEINSYYANSESPPTNTQDDLLNETPDYPDTGDNASMDVDQYSVTEEPLDSSSEIETLNDEQPLDPYATEGEYADVDLYVPPTSEPTYDPYTNPPTETSSTGWFYKLVTATTSRVGAIAGGLFILWVATVSACFRQLFIDNRKQREASESADEAAPTNGDEESDENPSESTLRRKAAG